MIALVLTLASSRQRLHREQRSSSNVRSLAPKDGPCAVHQRDEADMIDLLAFEWMGMCVPVVAGDGVLMDWARTYGLDPSGME